MAFYTLGMTPDSARSLAPPDIHPRDVPSIPVPGWAVRWDDGDFIATRETPLTSYQMHFGALEEITCSDAGELWLLVDAQTRLAERLTTAENHHAVGRQQRIEALQSQQRGRPPES